MMHQRTGFSIPEFSTTGFSTDGFSIIEMMISIMLSAILMTAGLTIYNQISKGAVTVARVTQQDTQIMVVRNRIATDLQGLIPLWFTAELYEKLKDTKKQEGAAQAKTSEPKQTSAKNKSNNFLYAQSQNDQFHLMTFVTTNALQIYGDQAIRTVRVVYFLKPDEAQPGTFKLLRKQDDKISADFDIEKLTEGKFDQIAHNITHCKIEYGFIDQKSDQKTNTSDKPLEFKFVSQWGINNELDKKDENSPTLPDVLKLTITIESLPSQAPKTYELLCNIASSQAKTIKSFAEKKHNEERTAKNNEPVWRQKTANAAATNGQKTPIISGNPTGLPMPNPVGQRG